MNYEKKIHNLFENEKISSGNLTILKRFSADLSLERKSESRRYTLLYITCKLATEIQKEFIDMEKEDVKDFVRSFAHLKDSSLRLYIINIKQFFKYLYESEDFPDVVKWMKPPQQSRSRKLPTDLIMIEEVKTMINAADHPRDRALIALIYESACRIGEIVNLDIKDITFDQYGAVIVVNGKTGMRRVRLINASPYISEWMNQHPGNRNDPVFISLGGRNNRGRLEADSCNSILKKIGRRAGIEKKIHPHLFRHSRLTELAKFMTEQELKIFAGWTGGSSMADVYVHLSGSDIDKKILENAGVILDEDKDPGDEILRPQECPRCKETNTATAQFCYKCGLPLSDIAGFKMDRDLEEMKDMMKQVLESSPDFLKNLDLL